VSWSRFHQHFTHPFCAKKLQSQNVTREKLRQLLLYKKSSHKMLMKLTTGVDFTTNIPCVAVAFKILGVSFGAQCFKANTPKQQQQEQFPNNQN
jgi:hypothetical protein